MKEYETISGQCVNFDKSTIFCSSNTSNQIRNAMSQTLGVRISMNAKRYLGLHYLVGKGKKLAFQAQKNRMH